MTPQAGPSFEPLTPTAFLDRSAHVHGDRTAVVDGTLRFSYSALRDRSLCLAGALAAAGVRPGDRVAVLAPNTHVLLECHYGVPFAGAVLVTLNTRLTADELGGILEHSGARVLIHDSGLAAPAGDAAGRCGHPVRLIGAGEEYERLLPAAGPHRVPVADERGLLAINYTSGTTGRPKGVMYHHRGAHLQSLAMALHSRITADDVYLWTLPMFHCNGWCFTWAVTAAGATHVCLPKVLPAAVWRLVREEGVTHLSAAPTVLTDLARHPDARVPGSRRIRVFTGGAPPAPALLGRAEEVGLDVTHLYGLTETFGPIVINEWRSEWDGLPPGEKARLNARQGVANTVSQPVRVVDPSGADVPADGTTTGEIAVRGNTVMLGYYRDPGTTAAAVPDGWFRTGDLGVHHPDGYVELRDRAKDVIISGGENIASVEVEAAILTHPSVLEAAVIPVPDDRWGERPAAVVTLRPGSEVTEEELRAYLRDRLPGFKVPDRVSFGVLPKTGTGKIQKHVLREPYWHGRERGIG